MNYFIQLPTRRGHLQIIAINQIIGIMEGRARGQIGADQCEIFCLGTPLPFSCSLSYEEVKKRLSSLGYESADYREEKS